jgi:magnesium transporter
MRVFHVAERCLELPEAPDALPASGFLWLAIGREQLGHGLDVLQDQLLQWCGTALVDLHVSDLRNAQLTSHFESTSTYDLLVFRRLTAGAARHHGTADEAANAPALEVRGAIEALRTLDTQPVGLVVFDRLLLSVHPAACPVQTFFAQRLLQATLAADGSSRLPPSPADLMMRLVNHMVDGYLELRRPLTRQLTALQRDLLGPRSRRVDWQALLESRNTLHWLEDVCDDQHSAVQEWMDALDEWPRPEGTAAARERELLRLRSSDVLEHIERVLGHLRRLEASAESAVQMHFSALSQRTNDVMRTLTVLTAVFLPLNLVTGIFGMNFDALPLIHSATGFWIALGSMITIGLSLIGFFWRKRYLGTRH